MSDTPTILAVTPMNGYAHIHSDDGTYTVHADDPEDLHRVASEEEHRAAVAAHRARVYRAAADTWETHDADRAEARR